MEERTRDNILTLIGFILTLLPFAWWGREMAELSKALFGELSFGQSMLFVGVSMLVLFIWIYINTLIHEMGHLVAGLLTKYSFVSFRIGSFTWVVEHGKLRLKKTVLKGTGGQCIMCPSASKPEDMEDTWYLLGGSLANLFLSSFCAFLYGSFLYSIWTYGIFFLCSIGGLASCIMNLFPIKSGGMVNDGYNIFIAGRKPHSKAAMYYLLTANARLSEAESPEALPEDLFQQIKEFEFEDLTNVYEGNLYMATELLYLSEENYEEARLRSEKLYETENVLGLFKQEAQCSLLYYELIGECREDRINELYTPKLKKYIRQTSCYPARKMLMFAYYSCYKKDELQATREACDLRALKDTYPVKFEYYVASKEVERLKRRNNAFGLLN